MGAGCRALGRRPPGAGRGGRNALVALGNDGTVLLLTLPGCRYADFCAAADGHTLVLELHNKQAW
jgi:hypothetical protein